ncbi:hypothetical protein C8Q80DRAFT_495671 [Daedaleopsis nitida]|nr:hypothetical protein C8Q80DRAFT_495671 [Daedaleopsis nitida]
MVAPFTTMFAAIAAAPASPEDATKQALLAVVQVWLDRLQSMAVVTTFFLSIDGMLYSFPARSSDSSLWSASDTLIIASLGGAIIFHVCASILAYCGAFVFIRYRLNDAEKQEEATVQPAVTSSTSSGTDHKQLRAQPLSPSMAPSAQYPQGYVHGTSWENYRDLRSLVSVHQIHPFGWVHHGSRRVSCASKEDPEASVPEDAVVQLQIIVRMLTRVHTVTAIMAVLGFILALLGTLAYFWTGLPRALGIFASACLGVCLLGGTISVL